MIYENRPHDLNDLDTPNALFQDTKKLDVNILKDEMDDDEIRN